MKRALPIALAGCVLACAASADARQVDLVASGAAVPANNSDYRLNANQLGYDVMGRGVQYEAELGAMIGVAWNGWLTVGPLVRGSFGHLSAPYGGMDPITTDAVFGAVRAEMAVFDFPRLFVWTDGGLGTTFIGRGGAYTHVGVWNLRGGVGMRVGVDGGGMRLRIGYSYAPTFGVVTPTAGSFDFGGFVVAFDGVIRVLG